MTPRTSALNRTSRGQRGETMVEFALSLTLLLTIIIGTFQFGQAVWQFNMVSDLAQEGARWASVRGSGAGTLQATAAQVQTYVQSRAPMTVTVATTSASSAGVCSATSVNPSSLSPGSRVCVNVQNTFTPITTLIPHSLITLQSTAQMIMAR